MLGEHFLDQWMDKTLQTVMSLVVIMFCIAGSILYSIYFEKKGKIDSITEDN